MSQPNTIFFGPDGSHDNNKRNLSKIYLRTLLYSTAKKGQVVENIYAKLRRGETQQNFNIWVYGNEKLSRGSGLFVGENGVVVNHHFLLLPDASEFYFQAGDYLLEVFVKLTGSRTQKCLAKIHLSINEVEATKLKQANAGIYFDWGPDSEKYYSHIDIKPITELPESPISLVLEELIKAESIIKSDTLTETP